MTNIILIFIALLIIILIWLINLVFVIISIQDQIQKSKDLLQENIRSYLDIVPLILFKVDQLNKDLVAQRSDWFNHWNTPEEHWPKFVSFDKTIDQIIKNYEIDNPEYKGNKLYQKIRDDLKEREYQVRAQIHSYNSLIIKFRHKLAKKLYRLAYKLDFKYNNKRYKLLADF